MRGENRLDTLKARTVGNWEQLTRDGQVLQRVAGCAALWPWTGGTILKSCTGRGGADDFVLCNLQHGGWQRL